MNYSEGLFISHRHVSTD